MTVLRLGTRRSPLAMAQSQTVAASLAARGHAVTIVPIVSQGDRTPGPLSEIGGTGVFVAELRQALLAGEVDLAVHSLKDLPTAAAEGLALAAVPPRRDPRDALCAAHGRGLGALAPGSRVGTSSPRRAAQLRRSGLNLHISDIRGNIDTRLARITSGDLDAVVLAAAGLARLGRADAITEELDPAVMTPAPGQGALAVECRADAGRADDPLPSLLEAALDDPRSRACVTAERTLLADLGAGCSAPVGALADWPEGDDLLHLRAGVFAPDGSKALTVAVSGAATDPVALGRRASVDLLGRGAAELMPAPRTNRTSSSRGKKERDRDR